MNIALKDSARDKLLPTIKPYLLVGSPTHVGGSINIMQIGKKKQMMYDAEYDRTGKNLGYSLNNSHLTAIVWLLPPFHHGYQYHRLTLLSTKNACASTPRKNTPSTISRRTRTMQRLA